MGTPDGTTLSRRAALQGLALAAPLALPAIARAEAPPVARPTVSSFRYRIGSFEVTSLYDGWYPLKTAELVTNQPLAAVEQALADVFLPTQTLPTPLTPLVVNTGRHLVLIDAGNGDQIPEDAGYLVKNMRGAGIDPHAIDTVLITHFHVDHVCGLRLDGGAYQFPNARILLPEPEWAFWMDDGNQSRAPARQQTYFRNARRIFPPIMDRVERFTPGREVVPGITSIATPGHTPGHTSYLLSSGDHQLLVWGDVTNHTDVLLRFPTWTPASDMDQELALRTRRRMLDMAIADRLRVSCYHAPFPANGYIRKLSEQEYRLVPLQWTEQLDGWR